MGNKKQKKYDSGKEFLLINKIDDICEFEIPDYYKIILILKIIRNWRDEF